MNEEQVLRRYVRYVAPGILSMIGLSCYILADTFFISNKIGAIGLAALNFAIPMYSVLGGVGLLLGVGGATRFAIHQARGEGEEGNGAFSQMIWFGLLLSVLFILLGWGAAGPLASFLGASGDVMGLTAMYLAVLLTFAPCFIFNNILVAFARNDSAPRLAMAAMVTGSLVNVVLDYVFIYPMDLGMFGAALATGISPTVSLLMILLLHIFPGHNTFHLKRCALAPRLIGSCCALGVSAFIGEFSSSVVMFTFNLVIFGLTGNFGVAAYGIIANTAYVVISIFNGVTQGSQPLLSEYYAREQRRQERQVLRYGLLTAVALGGLIWFGVTLFAPQIADIFNSEHNAHLTSAAVPGLRLYFIGFWLTGVNLMLAAFFAAVERPLASFAVSVSRGLVGIVALVLLMSRLWGMTGVWLSFPAAEIVTLAVALTVLFCGRKRATGRRTDKRTEGEWLLD